MGSQPEMGHVVMFAIAGNGVMSLCLQLLLFAFTDSFENSGDLGGCSAEMLGVLAVLGES
jgi:hypothetical protein